MDIINQIVAQEQSVFIMLTEFAVFTILISLTVYHFIIYLGRKSFSEGRLYLYFSGLFLGLLLYIYLDTCQFGILFQNVIDVPAWNTFLVSCCWLILLKCILLILEYLFKPGCSAILRLDKAYWGFTFMAVLSVAPVIFDMEQYHYYLFLTMWITLGGFIGLLLRVFIPLLRRNVSIDQSSIIIGWTTLLYISYIWVYRLITSSSIVNDYFPFWVINNFLKVAVAFTFAYALARRFNKEFSDLVELKENLEKKVEESTRNLSLAMEKIESTSRQRTNYFINVAHEIKTPLTLISNYLDRYSKRVGASNELDIVKQNFNLLREDMVLFLDVEKFEKGEVMYDHNQICNFSGILAMKMPLYSEEARQQSRTFHYELIENLFIQSDPLAVERIINNLFSNAMKFTQQQDIIQITLSKVEDKLSLVVTDSGIGIASSSIPHIFDLYFQETTSKTSRSGFGIGLYLVRKTVDSLNGTIAVKSELGKGTSFEVQIPLTVPPVSGSVNSQQFLLMSRNLEVKTHLDEYLSDRQNLLLVEDNTELLFYMKDELTDQYNVFSARNGEEAMRLLKTTPKPDIILSDVMMDKMDGFEFYRMVSANRNYNSIPFIFITARSNKAEKIEMLIQGVSDYIFKPFSMDELKAKISSILKNTSQHRKAGLQEAIDIIHSQIDMPEKIVSGKWELFVMRSREFDLTGRQIEIIKLVEQGLEYKQIANELSISLKTVHRHIQILFEKLQVHNKIELLNMFFGTDK